MIRLSTLISEAKRPFDYLSREAREVGKGLATQLNISTEDLRAASKNRIIILTDINRQTIMSDLTDTDEYALVSNMPGSSVGGLKHSSGVEIIIKPKSAQGQRSAGKQNEVAFFKIINNSVELNDNKPITVILKSSKQNEKYENVYEAVDASRSADGKGYIKADAQLKSPTGEVLANISLKKSNAVRWESLKARDWGYTAFENFVKRALNDRLDNVKLVAIDGKRDKYKMVDKTTDKSLSKVIVKNIPSTSLRESVFGEDDPQTIVVKQTFEGVFKDYKYEDGILTIQCDDIYLNINDIAGTGAAPVAAFSHHINQRYGIEFRMFTRDLLYSGNTLKGSAIEIDYNELK